jgi:hypothetical protein
VAGLKCEGPSKRKAEESFAAGDEPSRAAKRIDFPEGSEKSQGEEAAAPVKKKMWRLPKKEIELILAKGNEPLVTRFRDLKRANPSLVMSPEEEKDERTVRLYRCTREAYEGQERFAVFQAWVRREYAAKGSVEVDYDYFGRRAETTRLSKEAREKVFRGRDHQSGGDDDDLWRLVRSFV